MSARKHQAPSTVSTVLARRAWLLAGNLSLPWTCWTQRIWRGGRGSSPGGSAAGWRGPDSRRLTARRSRLGMQRPERRLLALREGPDRGGSSGGTEPLGRAPEALPGAHLLGTALIHLGGGSDHLRIGWQTVVPCSWSICQVVWKTFGACKSQAMTYLCEFSRQRCPVLINVDHRAGDSGTEGEGPSTMKPPVQWSRSSSRYDCNRPWPGSTLRGFGGLSASIPTDSELSRPCRSVASTC